MTTPEDPRPAPGDDHPLSWGIFVLARTHRAAGAALLARLGLAPGQELMLFQLWREDGVPQKRLTDLLGLDHSTVARSVRRMEAAGLLTRSRADYDGRVTLIHLTDQGRALEAPVRAAWAELDRRTTQALDPAAQETLLALMATVAAGLDASATTPPRP